MSEVILTMYFNIATIQWIITVICFATFLWMSGMNWYIFWCGFVKKRKTPSWAPLIGGVAGVIALAVVPTSGIRRWCWMPLFLDWGSLPGILHAVFWWKFIYPKYKDQDQMGNTTYGAVIIPDRLRNEWPELLGKLEVQTLIATQPYICADAPAGFEPKKGSLIRNEEKVYVSSGWKSTIREYCIYIEPEIPARDYKLAKEIEKVLLENGGKPFGGGLSFLAQYS